MQNEKQNNGETKWKNCAFSNSKQTVSQSKKDVSDISIDHDNIQTNKLFDTLLIPPTVSDHITKHNKSVLETNNDPTANDVQEGFQEGMENATAKKGKKVLKNTLCFPFYLIDRSLQFLTDMTCDTFSPTPTKKDQKKIKQHESTKSDTWFQYFMQPFVGKDGNFDYEKWKEYTDTKSADNKLVKKYITLFFLIIISWYFTYNWYFVLFFTNENGQFTDVPKLTMDFLSEYSSVLTFLFGYLLTPIIWLHNFLREPFRNFIMSWSVIRQPQNLLMLTYLIIVFFITHYSYNIMDLIDKCINYDIAKTATYDYTYVIFFNILYFIVLYNFMMGLVDWGKWFVDLKTVVATIIGIGLFVFQLLFTFLLVPMSGIVPIYYLIIMSVMGIAIFNKYQIFDGINKINTQIYNFLYTTEEQKGIEPEPTTFFGTLKILFTTLYKFCYKHLLEISLIYMIFCSMTDFTHNIHSTDLKAGLFILSIILIGFIICSRWYVNMLNNSKIKK